jgi:hypothetical protein
MRFIKTLTLAGALGLGLLAVGGGAARADILPGAGDPTVISLGGGLFQYDYHPFVSSTQRVENGDYFTIYDFPGLTMALVLPIDSGSIPNVTFTYAGPNIVGQQNLGIFSLVSTWTNPVFQMRNFAGRGTDIDSNFKNANLTNVKVPTTRPETTVPEPGTMALLGLGAAPLLGKLRRRFRKA